jgi:hypothetical protein
MTVDDIVVGAIYRLRTDSKNVGSLKRVVAFDRSHQNWPGGRITYVSLRPDGSVGARGRWAAEYFAQKVIEGPIEPEQAECLLGSGK